jgi:hypothetical protein
MAMRAVPPERARAGGADRPGDGTSTGPANPGLARQVAELSARLRPVCQDWGEAEFEALVLHIARMKVRWAEAGYRE